MSAPFSSKCVANECLRVCGLIFFFIPTFFLVSSIMLYIMTLVSFFLYYLEREYPHNLFLPELDFFHN